MSKRTRGNANRGGQRRPGNRPAGNRPATGRATTAARPSQLVAAETIAEDIIEGHPASAANELRAAAAAAPARSRAKPSGLLAAKAATEYVYVAQDVRRIVTVAAFLFAIMFVLWVVIDVVRIRF